MIAIVNIGGGDESNPLGERAYEVRINREVIATFKHKRSDGLGACLLAASKAVEQPSEKHSTPNSLTAYNLNP